MFAARRGADCGPPWRLLVSRPGADRVHGGFSRAGVVGDFGGRSAAIGFLAGA